MKYALFLRGINVGGIKVPMAELRDELGRLPLSNVKTYLQTGNVTLESDLNAADLKRDVEAALAKRFNYQAVVLIYDLNELAAAVKAYPFKRREGWHSYCLFTLNQAVAAEIGELATGLDKTKVQVAVGKRVVYWQVAIGQTLDNPFALATSRPKFKEVTTNRNLNTLEKMVG